MNRRSTSRTKTVMQIANEKAIRHGQESVEPVHLLLGLVFERSGVAARALRNLGIEPSSLQAEGDLVFLKDDPCGSRRAQQSQFHLPQSHRTKCVFESALEEADKLRHRAVDTEHLLLALVNVQDDDMVIQILAKLGVSPGNVRVEVMDLLGECETYELGNR